MYLLVSLLHTQNQAFLFVFHLFYFSFFFFNRSWFLFLSCLSLFFLSWLSSHLSAYQGCLIKQDSTRFLLSSPFFVGICFCHALLLLIMLSKPFLAHYCTPLTLFFYFTLNSSFFVCVCNICDTFLLITAQNPVLWIPFFVIYQSSKASIRYLL